MDISDKYRGFIIDLDGVIYLDGKLLPFSKNFVSKLAKEDKRYVFLTNDSNSSILIFFDIFADPSKKFLKKFIIFNL